MDKPYQRILTAIVGVPVLFIIIYLGGVWFLIFFLFIILLAQKEFLGLLKASGHPAQKASVLLSCVFIPVGAYFGLIYATGVFITFILVSLLVELMQKSFENLIARVGVTVFGITYISLFLSHAVLLRNIDQNPNIKILTENMQDTEIIGFFVLIFVVTCTFLNDTGAYYIGKWMGKRKLSPEISPGKTVEGTCGGIVAAIVAGGIVNLIFKSPLPYLFTFIFAFVVSLTAIFGDLFESMIKRSVGVKDSGAILPGHGGILDRFDSLIWVFPVSYYSILYYCFTNDGFKF